MRRESKEDGFMVHDLGFGVDRDADGAPELRDDVEERVRPVAEQRDGVLFQGAGFRVTKAPAVHAKTPRWKSAAANPIGKIFPFPTSP